jgi:hypothetical protein
MKPFSTVILQVNIMIILIILEPRINIQSDKTFRITNLISEIRDSECLVGLNIWSDWSFILGTSVLCTKSQNFLHIIMITQMHMIILILNFFFVFLYLWIPHVHCAYVWYRATLLLLWMILIISLHSALLLIISYLFLIIIDIFLY